LKVDIALNLLAGASLSLPLCATPTFGKQAEAVTNRWIVYPLEPRAEVGIASDAPLPTVES